MLTAILAVEVQRCSLRSDTGEEDWRRGLARIGEEEEEEKKEKEEKEKEKDF